MQFWEMSFYSDVQKSIRAVYLSNEEFAAEQDKQNNLSNHSDDSSTSSTASTGILEGITDSLNDSRNNKSPEFVDQVNEKNGLGELGLPNNISGKRQRPDKLSLFSVKDVVFDQCKEAKASNQFNDSNGNLLPKFTLNLYSRPNEKTALEICGEQMERVAALTEEHKENFIRNEQGIFIIF